MDCEYLYMSESQVFFVRENGKPIHDILNLWQTYKSI